MLRNQATMAAAERFEKALGEQLQQTSGVAPSRASRSQGTFGSVRTKSFSYVLPAASFAPGDLGRTATAAVAKWGEMATFPNRSGGDFSGGGGKFGSTVKLTSFELSFGGSRSHAFIECLAHHVTEPDGEKTHVLVLIRVFEGN
jgi:hypothetical protein